MSGAFTDGAAAAERILTKLRHDPSGIALTLGSPVVMVVLFGYIFGSAITVSSGDYRAFLIPGLFATIGVNIVPSMFTMARDSSRGVVDRFRSLPIARTAVPFGQAAATVVSRAGDRAPSIHFPVVAVDMAIAPGRRQGDLAVSTVVLVVLTVLFDGS